MRYTWPTSTFLWWRGWFNKGNARRRLPLKWAISIAHTKTPPQNANQPMRLCFAFSSINSFFCLLTSSSAASYCRDRMAAACCYMSVCVLALPPLASRQTHSSTPHPGAIHKKGPMCCPLLLIRTVYFGVFVSGPHWVPLPLYKSYPQRRQGRPKKERVGTTPPSPTVVFSWPCASLALLVPFLL